MDEKEENVIKRRYVSFLAALVLLSYVGYIIYRKLKFGEVNIDGTDTWILGVSISILLAVEAVKYWIKRKAGINANKE